MSTERFPAARQARPAPGALLLCRAEPESVAPAAQLLHERMLLTPAGAEWSVLVPEGTPWLHGGEPVDRVVTGWATALAVGAPWPVLAVWWDADRGGFTLASGFRRPVGYDWLAHGIPAGEDEAMRTFAARLGLDPVPEMRALDALTKPDPAADARARVRGLLAILARAGVALPAGLAPGEPADRLSKAARAHPQARIVEWPVGREAVRAGLAAVDRARTVPWPPWPGDPRDLSLAQVAVGLPLAVWGVRRRSGGWVVAGVLLVAHGVFGLTYGIVRPRD
ncbi:hypothetical protein [Streptomyces blattellae]|uniref:hypothetical protein n=1 Tax=Streptomyces blattellae TaxID=2569855 RepID=UPI0012B6FA8D|nr:hypothetical protein [Streptomyces blattellae]